MNSTSRAKHGLERTGLANTGGSWTRKHHERNRQLRGTSRWEGGRAPLILTADGTRRIKRPFFHINSHFIHPVKPGGGPSLFYREETGSVAFLRFQRWTVSVDTLTFLILHCIDFPINIAIFSHKKGNYWLTQSSQKESCGHVWRLQACREFGSGAHFRIKVGNGGMKGFPIWGDQVIKKCSQILNLRFRRWKVFCHFHEVV